MAQTFKESSEKGPNTEFQGPSESLFLEASKPESAAASSTSCLGQPTCRGLGTGWGKLKAVTLALSASAWYR